MSRKTHRSLRVLVAACCVVASLGLVTQARADSPTIDGLFAGGGPIGAGATVNLTVTGRGGVPASGAGAVALNVTATNPSASSYLTVWPAGAGRPTASNLNFAAGQTVPNMVIVPVGAGGQISMFNNSGGVDVVVDVLGWFPTGASYTGLTPARLMDTRAGQVTIDGQAAGGGQVGPAASVNLTVTGRGGVPGSGVGAVALNVTATNPSASSYLTVWPAGAGRPTASNLNFVGGETVPNMVIVPVDAGGQISIFNNAGGVDVIVDVLGWFPTGASYTGLTPARLMDTRAGQVTIDGQGAGGGQIGQGASANLTVTGRGGVPGSGVGAVALNVTATNPSASSYLTVWPAGAARPTASNLNFVGGETVPNMVVVPVGANGQISLFNNAGGVDVIVDVLGWFPTGASYTGLTPARLMDTRVVAPVASGPAAIGPIRNLLVVRPTLHQMAGIDTIAVWACDVPANTTSPDYVNSLNDPILGGPVHFTVDTAAVAQWATTNVSPYYNLTSNGRYQPTFVAQGHIPLSTTDGTSQCLDKAEALTGKPFTNVFVTDNSGRDDGFGGPGLISTVDTQNYDLFSVPPSTTKRGLWIGGASTVLYQSPAILAHEIGHTLHWPHSYIGPSNQYDDPTDVMSGTPSDGWCRIAFPGGGFVSWNCVPQNTIEFNRFAAGWVDESQVQLQQSGTNTYTLDAPAGGGLQMVAAPAAGNPHVLLTLEARPSVGNDRFLAKQGVAAYIIDQRPAACTESSFYHACISTFRRQSQAIGNPNTYDNVLQVGTTTPIDGLSITVLSQSGNTFTVQVSGTFVAPN